MTDPTPEQIEAVARAIYNADEPLSGDPLGVLIVQSEHLFPTEEHFSGRPTHEAYQLAAMDVCRSAARAAITALQTLDTQGEVSQGDGLGLVEPIGASFSHDLDAWVLYHNGGDRIGEIDGYESRKTVEAVLAALRSVGSAGERERCAKIAETLFAGKNEADLRCGHDIAAAIRAPEGPAA